MLTLVSLAAPVPAPLPGPDRAEVPADTPAAAEGFLSLVANIAPAEAGAAADPAVAQDSTEEAAEDDDTQPEEDTGRDAALAVFMGLPLLPPPAAPLGDEAGGAVMDAPALPVEPQTNATATLFPALKTPAPAASEPAEGGAQPFDTARRSLPVSASGMKAQPLAAEPLAPPDARGSAVESAALFRLREAAHTPAKDVSASPPDLAGTIGDTPPANPANIDQPPPTRAAEPAPAAPHRQAADHLTKLLGQAEAQLTTQGDRNELTLAPEELGRIRFEIRHHGDSLVVTLVAERPETLDLMRRHAGDLRSELAAAGYGSATLDFGDRDSPRQPPATPAAKLDDPAGQGTAPEVPTPFPLAPPAPAAGLDLRF